MDNPETNEPDFLDELIAQGEKDSPGFAQKVEDAYKRRVQERSAETTAPQQ